MNTVEYGDGEYFRKRKHSWWSRINWRKFMLYTGVLLFIYDVSYCIALYFYVKTLNVNQHLRLQEYKRSNLFMAIYYSLHHFLGDPDLHENDVAKWREADEL